MTHLYSPWRGGQKEVWANRNVPPGGWRTARTIESSDDGVVFDLGVAIDAEGNAIAVWGESLGSGTAGVWYNRFTITDSWDTASLLQEAGGTPRIAMGAQGEAIVLFKRQVADVPRLQSRYFTPSGGWEDPVLVDVGDGDPLSHQVAIDDRGNALAVWRQDDGARQAIWFNRFTPAGGWQGPQLLENGTVDADEPQISIDPQGTATAVWEQDGIWARHLR